MDIYGNKLAFTWFAVSLNNGGINTIIKQWDNQVMSGH